MAKKIKRYKKLKNYEPLDYKQDTNISVYHPETNFYITKQPVAIGLLSSLNGHTSKKL